MATPPLPAGFVVEEPEKKKVAELPPGFVVDEPPEEKGLLDRSLDTLRLGVSDAISTVRGDTYGKYGEDYLTRTPMTNSGRLLKSLGGDIAPAVGSVGGDVISSIAPDFIKNGLKNTIAAMKENKASHPIYANADITQPISEAVDMLPPEIGDTLGQGANIAAFGLPNKARFSKNADSNFQKYMDDRDKSDTQRVLEPYNIKKPDVQGTVTESGRTNYQNYNPTDIEQRQYERTAQVPDWEPRRSARHNINAIEAEVDKRAAQLEKDLFDIDSSSIPSSRTNRLDPEGKRRPHKTDGLTLEDDIYRAIEDIKENPMLQGNAADSVRGFYQQYLKILKKYEAGREVTPQDLLRSRKEFDELVRRQSADDVYDPQIEKAKTIAIARIRQVINNKVNDAVPDARVKESLSHQADLLTSRDHLYQRDVGESRSGLGRAVSAVEDTTGAAPPRSPFAFIRNVTDVASMVLAGTVATSVLFGRNAVKQGKRLKGATQKAVDAAINAGDTPALLAILNNEDNYEDE